VGDGVDLRETGGPGRIESMTDGAPVPVSRDGRLGLHGSSHVAGSRAMANLTGDAPMIRVRPEALDVGVAKGAFLAPGVPLLVAGDGVQGGSSIVAQLAEGIRNEKVPSHDESDSEKGEDHDQTGDLLGHG